ncbi:fibrinolytic enzyme, isozyme C-like isoform X2 [Ostrea edulis]|uniref:fibrinolytic enzyme, isozyme C-like isoform X2 n=1 Tax=Ostrea edulis TaxID=37623 RepID=UPI0024AF9A12|nr:fibrinolytic enzyme, isozyme C-like isoform X2 [Ostrea edulis]
MKVAVIVAFLSLSCAAMEPKIYQPAKEILRELALKPKDYFPRIVNGQQASPGAWPWQVSLQLQQSQNVYHICGGSLVRPNLVVTAAHCVDGQVRRNLRIEAGIHRVSETGATSAISRIIMHPQYSSSGAGFPNDIALLELDSPFTLGGDIKLATLPTDSNEDFTNNPDCYITGWGRTSGGGPTSDVLMEAQMTNIANTECQSRWSYVNGAAIYDTHICPFEPSKSACNGDSGGPYVCSKNGAYMLAGVTSWGISTCDGTFPSVYTRVSKYLDWMANYI